MSDKPLFSISDWSEAFENHESRKVRILRWVPVPNKHDGKGFKRISRDPQGVAVFCAWNLMIQVASRMPVRGVLADEDGPLDADDLADKTNFPAEIFEAAFTVLTRPGIGWLTKTGDANGTAPPAIPVQASATATPSHPKTAMAKLPDPPFSSEAFLKEWEDYKLHRKQMKKPLTPIACGRLFIQFAKIGESRATAALIYSMADGRTWQGVFEDPKAVPSQASILATVMETPEQRKLKESCQRCMGTDTELVPGKGARPCTHEPLEDEE